MKEDPEEESKEPEEETNDLHKAHLIQTLQAIQYINTIKPPGLDYFNGRFVEIPPSKHPHNKTIIFDLDETLVHCVDDPDTDNPDVVL